MLFSPPSAERTSRRQLGHFGKLSLRGTAQLLGYTHLGCSQMQRSDGNLRKIAVLRANGLGDFLLATPALRALGRGFPTAEIIYLTLPWLRDFIAGRYPYLRRVEAIPPYPGINQPRPGGAAPAESVGQFFARLQAEDLDLAIQMHGGGADSNPFVSRLGAKRTLGLAAPGAQPMATNLRYCYYQHEIIRYLELVGKLGVAWDGLEMEVPVLDADRARLGQAWGAIGRRYAILHPGAGDGRRRWPVERFARVGEHIHERAGYTVVVTGREDEVGIVERLKATCRAPVVDLCDRLDLGAMAALIAGAGLMVCNDTGPAHMAFALNVPSVVIYWCGNVITAGPLKRERFRPVLSWTLECPSCHTRGRCSCPESWVAEAPLDEVLAQVDDLLEIQ